MSQEELSGDVADRVDGRDVRTQVLVDRYPVLLDLDPYRFEAEVVHYRTAARSDQDDVALQFLGALGPLDSHDQVLGFALDLRNLRIQDELDSLARERFP